jgi:hypothetical protein
MPATDGVYDSFAGTNPNGLSSHTGKRSKKENADPYQREKYSRSGAERMQHLFVNRG